MSPEATLRSDHVNLLIFRYLQESGFELAATAFYKDWHRGAEYRDPENLPFAHTLQRNELISVVQAGLHYDHLRARASKSERKFRWTSADAQDGAEDGVVENGASSREASSQHRKGRPSIARAADDFPVPAPKRQRRSEEDEPHVNGDRDAMDIDNASADADADAEGEEDGDVPSPAVMSEPEPTEIMERYDSVMTQTEAKSIPKTSTMSWTIDRPGANALQGLWNPNTATADVHTFLAVGDNLCRFYQLPENLDDRQIDNVDEPSLTEGSTVTACAWRPDGEAASIAIDTLRTFPDESTSASLSLIERGRNGHNTTFQLLPPFLEPAGITLSISYSPDGQYLLAGRTNLKRGLVQVWLTSPSDPDVANFAREPIAWRMLENQINDVVWTGKDTFAVCGENGLSSLYQVDANQQQDVDIPVPGSIAMRGLIAINPNLLTGECSWSHVSMDQRNGLIAFASAEAGKLVVTSRLLKEDDAAEKDAEIELPDRLTAVAFQPLSKATVSDASATSEQPSLVAAAFESGLCMIYSTTRSSDFNLSIVEVASLSLAEGPATAMAWSPNGEHLAVGNADIMQIWQASSLKRKNGVVHATEAAITWRPAVEANGVENGHADEDKELPQPSLSWSADGESLSFAADKQIAVIRFQPRLQAAEVNGRDTP